MGTPGKTFHLPRLTRLPLAVEIAVAVTLKLLLLAWLWQAFFSAPPAQKMRMPTAQVEQHLLALPPDTFPPRSAPTEATHDPHR